MTSLDHEFGVANLIRNKGIGRKRAHPLPPLLAQLLARAGEPAIVERAVSRPWASALFEGQRHMVRLRLSGEDFPERGSAFMAGLADAEWVLPGHFVADISVDDGDADMESVWLELSALTIEDW